MPRIRDLWRPLPASARSWAHTLITILRRLPHKNWMSSWIAIMCHTISKYIQVQSIHFSMILAEVTMSRRHRIHGREYWRFLGSTWRKEEDEHCALDRPGAAGPGISVSR